MTYTEAVKSNVGLVESFREPKQLGDGVGQRWVRDIYGSVGYLRSTRSDAFLLCYPVKVFKSKVGVVVQSWPIEAWDTFDKLT